MGFRLIKLGMLGVLVVVAIAADPASAAARPLTLEYSFDRPEVSKVDIAGTVYDRLSMAGCPNGGSPGQPALPAKGAYILLPLGTKVSSIQIVPGDRVSLGADYLVEPVARPVPLSADPGAASPPTPDPVIYASIHPFPEVLFEDVGTHAFRGYQILIVKLRPVQYVPASGELYYHPRLTVTVNTVDTGRAPSLFRGLEEDRAKVLARVDNPEMADSYAGGGARGSRNYSLLILTTTSLASAFEPLKTHHDAYGIPTEIHTTVDVGSNNPDDLRAYIRDRYDNDGIEYVIIGGDDDIIPAKDLYVSTGGGGYVEYNMPSDIYFACLDGTYNYDGDAYWGEPNDGEGGGDVDLVAEVYVGRAAVGNTTEAVRFVNKTIWYVIGQHSRLENILLVGEYLGFGGVAEYAGNYLDELIDGSSAHGYTTVGIPSADYVIDTLYDRDWPGNDWPASELVTRINGGLHVVNHLGHGSPNYAMKLYNSDVLNLLTNNDLFFVYSQTCSAGHFDGTDCWAETANVKTDHGAFGVVMNARYGFGEGYSTDGPSQRFNREFWDAVYNPAEDLRELGRANHDSKEDNLYRINESCMRWCYYELNLFGDPTVMVKGTCTDAGTVTLDRPKYACENTVRITVNDCGLNLDSGVVDTVILDIDSDSETGVEQVTLTETRPDSAEFEGSIALSATNSSGVLLVADGDTVTVTYIDADDGQGGYNVVVTATAVVDCAGPVISNVAVSGQSSDTATVTFDTDESAIGTVRYGLSCGLLTGTVTEWIAGTSHTLELTGLDSGTQYYFAVDAMDVGGNLSTDDNGGSCYSFSTLGAVYAFTMDSDPGWSTQGLWAFGQPTGGGGASGGPDPTSGYTGSSVYGYNLDGDYTNDMPVYYLTMSALDLTGTTDVQLRFWKWLGIENALFDHANVQVSNDGTSWTTIWEHTGGNTADSEWSQMVLDISAVADDQALVHIRWGMGRTDASDTYCGWNIDDVEIWGVVAQPESCEDGIQNQGEARIDCGGPCPPCDCLSANECDDGLFCTGVETCNAYGHCQPGTPVNCDDGVGCTADSCDEVNDTCVNAPDDELCDDGEFCDGAETCDPVDDCQAGTPVDCADGVFCTVDWCDEVNDTCVNAPDDGLCDDGEFCNGAETCDPVDDCQAGAYPCGAGAWCNEEDDACIPHGSGDFDGDGDVDLGDFTAFQVCFDQPTGLVCEPGNMAGVDEMIDLEDYAAFFGALNGPQ